jgi:hypothetical protein
MSRSKVYADAPYGPGEVATYEVYYLGMLVGYGNIGVGAPEKQKILVAGKDGKPKMKKLWHRVFYGDASTGDWYKAIFVGKDKMRAYSRPWNYGVTKFYMEQDEGKLWGKKFRQKKWLEFNHQDCVVNERIKEANKDEVHEKYDLARGGIDALGAMFFLRSQKYVIGKKVRAPIYTSKKNWWLEITPIAKEDIEVAAGKFKAVKLKLQSFLGKDLEQKGDLFAWISAEAPFPLLKIEGEVKVGYVTLALKKFKKGK